jgi:hypothetical protein
MDCGDELGNLDAQDSLHRLVPEYTERMIFPGASDLISKPCFQVLALP